MKTRAPSIHARERASVLAWLMAMLAAAVCVVLTAAAGVWSMLHASPDVATLRDSVLSSTAFGGEKEIELSVGPMILGMARAGLNFVDLEPEVRSALGAVRGASVGVYRIEESGSRTARAGMADTVDQVMTERGWERILGVVSERELVLAYVPDRIASARDLRVSVLVLDGQQLVVTSVRANPEPVIELLLREAGRACPSSAVRVHRQPQGIASQRVSTPWVRVKS